MQPCALKSMDDWREYFVFAESKGGNPDEIDLSNKGLTDQNIVPLAEYLEKEKRSIKCLDLRENKIGDLGAKAIAVALILNDQLIRGEGRKLIISNNPNIGKEGIKALYVAFNQTDRLHEDVFTLDTDEKDEIEKSVTKEIQEVEHKIREFSVESYLEMGGLDSKKLSKIILRRENDK